MESTNHAKTWKSEKEEVERDLQVLGVRRWRASVTDRRILFGRPRRRRRKRRRRKRRKRRIGRRRRRRRSRKGRRKRRRRRRRRRKGGGGEVGEE